MNLWSWNKGRQNTGYEAFPFIISSFCDAYLLRYKPGTEIPWHKDKIAGKKHYRLNIILTDTLGGVFMSKENMIFENAFVKLFRPDLNEHCVTEVYEGTRYVLSFGLALRARSSVG